MGKVSAVIFDLTGDAMTWLDQNCDDEHVEICEFIKPDEDGSVQLMELPRLDGWDVLLVFERNMRRDVEGILADVGIDQTRVLYPLDIEGSLIHQRYLSGYMFKGLRDSLDYLSFRQRGEYALAVTGDTSYINVSTDNMILPSMYLNRRNWALEEMTFFYEMSVKYHTFNRGQTVFCDIGANIGTTCVWFKKHFDPDVKILAFEPSPLNYTMLRVNMLLNGIEPNDHMLVRKGVSDISSTGKLVYNPQNPGSSYFSDSDPEEGPDGISLVSFDEYVESAGIDVNALKYMWIDVEGFEARFLAGAKKTLNKISIPVFMEFNPEFYRNKPGEFDLLMNGIQEHFKSYICAQHPEWRERPVESLWDEQNNRDASWDLFLIHK